MSSWSWRSPCCILPPPLRSNEVVLEKLMRIEKIKKYPEDTDLLEDVIIENSRLSRWRTFTAGS